MQAPALIYKVVTAAALAEAIDTMFVGMPVDLADGYMHFSTAAQLPETLRRHFAGQSDLWLLAVHTELLGEVLHWEPSRGGDLFPHLYGPLPLTTLAWQEPLSVGADGSVNLPEAVE